ncbi:MAG: MFS transporter [Euzebyales bacterium]|nr:MFS transporter [Euzebyales bacterium]
MRLLAALPERYRAVLAIPPFRRFALGAIISSVGDGMSSVAVAWLALEIAAPGREGLAVGLALGAFTLPAAIAGTVFGAQANRLGARRLILLGSATRGGFLAVVPVLAWTGALTLPVYIALLVGSSLFYTWGIAGRTAMVAGVVDEPLRMPANSLLLGQSQLAMIVGPGAAGLLVHLVDAATVLALDALTFAGLFLIALTLPNPSVHGGTAAAVEHVRLWRTVDARLLGLLGVTLTFYLLYGPFEVALPVHVTDNLAGDALLYGVLLSCFGVGALVGNIAAGALPRLEPWPMSLVIVVAWGVAVLVIGLTSVPAVALVAVTLGGLIYGPHPALITTVIQRGVPAAQLPRVSAAWASAVVIVTPVGNLIGGPLTARLGPSTALALSGAATVLLGLLGALWLAGGALRRARGRLRDAAAPPADDNSPPAAAGGSPRDRDLGS